MKLIYPQLPTGASTHYPASTIRFCRTVVNTLPDGHQVRFADPGGDTRQWRLSYTALTDHERRTLEKFFADAEGRLNAFLFLDPMGNLLTWSEEPDNDAWTKDPMIVFGANCEDPLGTTRAASVQNTSTVPQKLTQIIQAPADYVYTLSVYARAESAQTAALIHGSEKRTCNIGPNWRRLTFGSKGTGAAESIEFGLELAGGTTVEVFGFQVDAQPGASGYKRTGAEDGIYSNARFRDDSLTFTAQGPDQNSGVVYITHANHL